MKTPCPFCGKAFTILEFVGGSVMIIFSKILQCLWVGLWLLVFGALPAYSIEESDFQRHYQEKVLPILESSQAGVLTASDGYQLAYHVFRRGGPSEQRPSVMILTGYAESWRTYGETIVDLDQAGYDVFVMDHRGMGFSGRLTPDPRVAHITSFQLYVDDARAFLHQVVLPRAKGRLYLLAHSMGGLVGAYLLERDYKNFRAAAFSAPLFQLNTGLIPELAALGAVELQLALGRGANFAPGKGDFDPKAIDPSKCSTTRSLARCKHQLELYQKIPETFIAGPSNQWVKEVILATRRLPEVIKAFRDLPILILQAEEDAFVREEGQARLCSALPHCQLKLIRETFHEILQEKDPARNFAMGEMIRFFRANSGNSQPL
jgi:lysophospholipase